jgi:hypothetical protein
LLEALRRRPIVLARGTDRKIRSAERFSIGGADADADRASLEGL